MGEDESTEAVAVFVDMEDEEITPGDEENAHPRGRQRIRYGVSHPKMKWNIENNENQW